MNKFKYDFFKDMNESMNDGEKSILKLGGIITVAAAVLYIVITVMIAVDPVGMYMAGGEGFDKLLNNPFINIGWRGLFALQNILNIIIIKAFYTYVKKNNEKYLGILSFSNIIMTSGAILAAVNWMHFIEVTMIMLNQYKAGVPMEQIVGIHYFPIDSFFLWTWGFYGLGFLTTNAIAFYTGKFSKRMGVLGIICGLQLISLVIFYITKASVNLGGMEFSWMMLSAGLLGGITGPVFMYSCRKYYVAGLGGKNESFNFEFQSKSRKIQHN